MDESTTMGVNVSEGIIAVLFGFAAVFWPGLTIVTLLYLFAGFVLASGIINLIAGLASIGKGVGSWFLRVLLGVIQIGVGVYLLRHPHVTFATLILLIGFTLIFRGVLEVVMSFMADTDGGSRAMLLIVGILAVLSGTIILFQPVSAGIAFVWILGLYALVMGPVVIASAMSQHKAALNATTQK